MTTSTLDIFELTLKSHPGKALVLSNRKDKDGHHTTEYMELGDASKAIKVKYDSCGLVMNADNPG